MEGLSMRTKGLTMTDDLELSEQQRLQIFYSFVEVSVFDTNIDTNNLIYLVFEKVLTALDFLKHVVWYWLFRIKRN